MNDEPPLRKSGILSLDWLPGSTGGLPGPCARCSTCCARCWTCCAPRRRCRSATSPSGSTSPPSVTLTPPLTHSTITPLFWQFWCKLALPPSRSFSHFLLIAIYSPEPRHAGSRVIAWKCNELWTGELRQLQRDLKGSLEATLQSCGCIKDGMAR